MDAKLQLGRLLATPGALEALKQSGQGVEEFLVRHVSGDWGVVSDNHLGRLTTTILAG